VYVIDQLTTSQCHTVQNTDHRLNAVHTFQLGTVKPRLNWQSGALTHVPNRFNTASLYRPALWPNIQSASKRAAQSEGRNGSSNRERERDRERKRNTCAQIVSILISISLVETQFHPFSPSGRDTNRYGSIGQARSTFYVGRATSGNLVCKRATWNSIHRIQN
jgi:hypothetical protein